MRASWIDVNGRKVVASNVYGVIESEDDIVFKADSEDIPIIVYVDGIEFISAYRLQESCRFIDSEIILSADKE